MTSRRRNTAAGFTLIEVLLAVGITAAVMMTIGTTFSVLLEAREVVDELTESTEAGPRILNLIERDLRGLWVHNVKGNAVFRGRNMDVAGFAADRMDFLTTTDAVAYVLDGNGRPRKPTICEVGYWFKQNPRYRELMELWRREDPMVDRDLITQGSFQLVHDRIKSFRVVYFKELGNEAEEILEWDSSTDDLLPRRIKIEFVIERRRGSSNIVNDIEVDDFEGAEKKYVRHIVIDKDVTTSLRAEQAVLPILPPEPTEPEPAGGGPAGPGGKGGPAGAGPVAATGKEGEELNPVGQRGQRGTPTTSKPGERGGRGEGQGRGNPSSAPRNGGQPPNGMPPGFNLGELLRGGGGGGNAGGLFGGGGGR